MLRLPIYERELVKLLDISYLVRDGESIYCFYGDDRQFAVPGIVLGILSLVPYVVYMVNKSDYDSSHRSFINRGYVIKKALEASKSNAELTAVCVPDAIKWNKDLADRKSEYIEGYSDKKLLTMDDLTW